MCDTVTATDLDRRIALALRRYALTAGRDLADEIRSATEDDPAAAAHLQLCDTTDVRRSA